MTATAVILKRIRWGWAVALTDGREIVRFIGPGARRKALRYVGAEVPSPSVRGQALFKRLTQGGGSRSPPREPWVD